MTAAVVSVAIAAATWYRDGREIAALRQEVAALRAQLAPAGSRGAIIDVANAPALGPADAPVTLVEFSDYECPFCIRHFQQTMPQIDATYIRTGKIRYVFQDFPIDQNHPEAIRAHEAAHCALEQQKYWDLHFRLFSKPGTHTASDLEGRAQEAGLSLGDFRTCVASGRTIANIRRSADVAVRLGADGTPAFFVGVRDLATDKVRVVRTLMGAQPFSVFQDALDAALGGK